MRDDIDDLINQTAYRLYRRYRRWASAEDIRQEMWAWVSSRPQKRIDDMETATLRWRLQDVGEIHCRKEKANRSGYHPDDEAFYSMRVIRELLPNVVLGEEYLSRGVDDSNTTTARKGASGSSMNYETAMVDLRAAYEKLSENHRLILESQVEFGMAEAADVTRALRALQRRLGGRRPRKGD